MTIILHLESLPARTSKGELLHFLCSTGGIDRQRVGLISLVGTSATVEVPEGWATRLAKALDGSPLKNRRLRAWAAPTPGAGATEEDHFQRLIRLLDLEARAEARQAHEQLDRLSAQEAECGGHCLADLVITEEYAGLGGRCLLTLVKRNRTLALPGIGLGVGAPVLLTEEGGAPGAGCRGVICERHESWVRVAVSEPPAAIAESPRYRLSISTDEVARSRQRTALERARAASRNRLVELRQVLLGETAPAFDAEAAFSPLDSSLNASQQEALRFALAARDVAVIHGPPGTGKTTTVVELIRQALRRGEKVLACAPSNLAVDNLLEKLLAEGEPAIRLGHPARVLPALRAHTLDLMVEDHADVRLARKFAKEAHALFRKAARYTRAKPEPGARRDMRQEARALLTEARRLEAQAIERILDASPIVCATTTGLDDDILGRREFDLAIIDEACQSTEPGCWIPLGRCRRVVLAGDHCQLPPTVVSAEAAAQGFNVSLLERQVALHGAAVVRRLNRQYRMHEAIMNFSSREFYEGSLEAAESVRGHRLCDLPGVGPGLLTETPVYFLDTAGAGFEEQQETGGDSRFNPPETALVCRKVRKLLEAGVAAGDIAVIAPYAAQVRRLREELGAPGVEIDSVDGFQGREKEAVVISLVRSNTNQEIGFLADVRRMNVALTRARRLVLVIGDSATLAVHPFYQRLFGYFEEVGGYHSVWEEAI